MTRLRYIVDRPRGPRGGHDDVRHLYTEKASAKRAAAPRRRAQRDGDPDRIAAPGTVLEIDLDDLLPVDASIEDQAAWHERKFQHHYAELMRLRPHADAAAPVLTTSDMSRIREAVSRWDAEEDRLRRGGGATPAARGAFFLLRDLWREGKLG